MCGRFTQMMTWEELLALIEGDLAGQAQMTRTRYNIAPTQPIVTIVHNNTTPALMQMPWGGKLNPKSPLLFNARSEKYLGTENNFWKRWRRCLIPANGFYEWQKAPGGKVPMYITVPSQNVVALGGLYWGFQHGDFKVDTAVVLTTAPNELMAPIHNRMPVILRREHHSDWLNPNAPSEIIQSAAAPYPTELMTAWAVSATVNSAANDVRGCVDPVPFNAPGSDQLDLL